jgi:hypothetical protein
MPRLIKSLNRALVKSLKRALNEPPRALKEVWRQTVPCLINSLNRALIKSLKRAFKSLKRGVEANRALSHKEP